MRRRAALRALAMAPLAAVAVPPRAEAKDYALPEEVLRDIARLEADVDSRLAALLARVPEAGPFVVSVQGTHRRHQQERAALAGRLGLPGGTCCGGIGGAPDLSLAELRKAQEALVYAHAEGLPVLPSAAQVDLMARHMVEEARHLTVIDLWIDAEEQRG